MRKYLLLIQLGLVVVLAGGVLLYTKVIADDHPSGSASAPPPPSPVRLPPAPPPPPRPARSRARGR